MIEEAVLQRVLGSALKTGGEFAEVFAEDSVASARRCSTTARSRSSPRAATGAPASGSWWARPPASPTPPTSARPACWPRPRPPRPRPRAAAAAPAPSPSPVGRRPAATTSRPTPATCPRPARSSCSPGPTRSPAPPGGAISQVSVSYGDNRRRILVANSDGLLAEDDQVRTLLRRAAAWPPATPACRPAASRSATPSASSCSTCTTSTSSPAGPPAGPSPSWPPARRPAARMPVVIGQRRRRRAVPRGVRPRPRGRPRRPRAPRCSAAASASRSPRRCVTLVDDGTMAERVGAHRHRRRGQPRPAQRAHRGRRAHRLHVGPPAGPQGGPALARATAGARATSTCRWCA